MNSALARRLPLWAGFCLGAALARPLGAQSAPFSSEAFSMGPGGYAMNFDVLWTCDDDPRSTQSMPGRIDLLDPSGALVGQLSVTAVAGRASVSVSGAGAASNLAASIHLLGANGTPADGTVSGTWTLPNLGAGTYSFRFWVGQNSVPRDAASTITTQARDAGGGGPVGAPQPPTATIAAAGPATVFQPVTIVATATAAAGASLASVVVDVSPDDGRTWTRIAANASPASPSDTERVPHAFGAAGSALLRATATDSVGLVGVAEAPLPVAKADQPSPLITPPSAVVMEGQSVTFTASGGATGNYTYAGAASGQGAVQTVGFPAPGAYVVTVVDAGNANYNPSPPASAPVSVQPAFFTLSLTALPGGAVAGGGSYPPGALAMATATADPGFAFTGWTGDQTSAAPAVSVLMTGNKSLAAHFTARLAQTITFAAPRSVTTRTPPFALVATASSGLPVAFALDSGPAALSGGVLAPSGTAGLVTVTATQPGNAVYLPALPVVVSFPIGPPPPGVLLTDDGATTRRSDKYTRTTSFRCGPPD